MRIKVVLRFLTGALISASSLSGSTIYTYIGNQYTAVCTVITGISGCSGTPLYATSDSITGQVTLTSSLGDNLTLATVNNVLGYSFADGIDTWTPADSSLDTFQVSTNSLGNITSWQFYLNSNGGAFPGIVLVTCGGAGLTISQCSSTPEDFADVLVSNPSGYSYGINTNPGVWATAAATPEPSSFLLMIGGVLTSMRVLKRARHRRYCLK